MISAEEYRNRYNKGKLKGFKICNNHIKEAEPQKIAINHKKTNSVLSFQNFDQPTFTYRGEADFNLNLEEEAGIKLPTQKIPNNNYIYFFIEMR